MTTAQVSPPYREHTGVQHSCRRTDLGGFFLIVVFFLNLILRPLLKEL